MSQKFRNRPNPYPLVGQVTVSGTLDAGANMSQAISFGRTFATPPKVFPAIASYPAGSGPLTVRTTNVTTTGCTLFVYNTGSASVTWTDLLVNWQAVGA